MLIKYIKCASPSFHHHSLFTLFNMNDDVKSMLPGMTKMALVGKKDGHMFSTPWKHQRGPRSEVCEVRAGYYNLIWTTIQKATMCRSWIDNFHVIFLCNGGKLQYDGNAWMTTWRLRFLRMVLSTSSAISTNSRWTSSGNNVSPRVRASVITVDTWIAWPSSVISRRICLSWRNASRFFYL